MIDASRIDCSVDSSTRFRSAVLAARTLRANAADPSVMTLMTTNSVVSRYLLIISYGI